MNSAAQVETFSPSLIALQHQVRACKTKPTAHVGMSEAELEHHIDTCNWLANCAMERYETTSDLSALGEAHRWGRMRDEAIKGRKA